MVMTRDSFVRSNRFFLNHFRSLILTIGLLLALTMPLSAAEETTSPTLPAASYPGLEEFTPRVNDVASRAIDAEQQISNAEQVLALKPKITDLQENLEQLEDQFTDWEQLNDWPLSLLMEGRSQYSELQRQQMDLQKSFSAPLMTLEEIQITWTKELDFWQGWVQSLRETWQQAIKSARIKAPKESLERTLATIQDIIDKNTRMTNQLLQLQQSFSTQQEMVTDRVKRIDLAMHQLRQEAFRRSAPAVFAPEFYRQFSEGLLAELKNTIEATLRLPGDFLKRYAWVTILQGMACLIIGLLLTHRRNKTKPITRELHFLFAHPWAGAGLAALILFSRFYATPPALWRWGILVLGATAATVLIVAMYQKPLIRKLIRLITVILVMSETMQLIGLPRPLQQVFLIGLCTLILITALTLARREGHDEEATRSGLTMLLYMGVAIGLTGITAGLIGFVTFSANLVEAFIGTIMVVLFTIMLIRIADGSVYAFMKKDWVRDQRFVQRLGIQTTERLQTLLHIFLLSNAFVYLFVAWNIFETPGEAWAQLLSLEYTVGDFTLSLRMVVLIALVLYLTNLASWVLQALLDAQVLTPRGMAFGVRAAFKRLIHYALFTIGFFIAISMAGIGLEKFAIIAGALGVGIGFGLQNIVNNFISGLILLFERPIKIGDTISLEGQWGTISKIGLRSTVVETLDRSEVIVPNADLISQKVTNWTLTNDISRIVLNVGVAYGSPLDKVLKVLMRVSEEHPDVLKDPQASALFTGFGESSLDFELRVWVADISQRLIVKSDLGQAIDHYFREEGITIPFPQRDLHLRSIEDDLRPSLIGAAKPAED